jgi:two-component system chemotaxis sensor kinase CheA
MPIIEDDEVLQIFIEESKEHLDGIESDFLDIEEMGEHLDLEIVNKVFRAIHSVKGGAGFLGLDNIKELSHSMENLLNLIRNEELTPNSGIINALLEALDTLKDMINNYLKSNEMDIASQLASLKGATIASVPEAAKESIDHHIQIASPSGRPVFTVSEFELEQAGKGGRIIYLVEYDLLNDIERKKLTPMDVIKELQQAGILIDSQIDIDAIGNLSTLGDEIRIPFCVLFSTVLEEDIIPGLVKVDLSQIYRYTDDKQMKPLSAAENKAEVKVAKKKKKKGTEKNKKIEKSPSLSPKPIIEKPQKTPVQKAIKEVDSHNSVQETAAPPQLEKPQKKKPASDSASASKQGKNKTIVPKVSTAKASSLRVNVTLLDKLMNLAGELVLTRNQLSQTFSSGDALALEKAVSEVDLITSELQAAIMSTRMQPIGIVFTKFQRLVRDMSKNLGKQVDLILEGEDVELDKTIIEAIGDPLTHLVRNSIDHGIELPNERAKAGKNLPALIKLSASHEAGQVIIQVKDDGGGIDPVKIKKKALEVGLMEKAQLDDLSTNEIIRLIFKPGFSTATEVTDVSGRGVGMDVVHSNLSKLGGAIDIFSDVGIGTTIRIKLPLTLAIIPSLIVEVEQKPYAIPQVSLVELVRIPASQVKDRVEKIDNAAVLRLRGKLLPLIRVTDALSLERTFKSNEDETSENCRRDKIYDRRSAHLSKENDNATDSEYGLREEDDRRASRQSAYNIAVVNAGDFNYGLIVDALLDSEEIVVKPLGSHIRQIKTYAGATILGDGKAALILDIMGISHTMDLRIVENKAKKHDVVKKSIDSTDAQSLLVIHNSLSERFGIPLGLVSRIEKINKSEIEETSGKKTIKYRGGSLLLCSIEDVANVKPREDVERPFVIIFPFAGKEVGILISQIVDVVTTGGDIDEETFRQPGVLGSSIIMEHTTLLLDLYGIVSTIMPEWVDERKIETKRTKAGKSTILLIEDSKFFLNQVKNFVEDAGYEVLTALDGVEGLEVMKERGSEIDLILTDIEMPNMDGVEFAEQIRNNKAFFQLPMIALTSVAGEEAEKRAFDAGIDEYLIKLDREKVLERVAYYIKEGRNE